MPLYSPRCLTLGLLLPLIGGCVSAPTQEASRPTNSTPPPATQPPESAASAGSVTAPAPTTQAVPSAQAAVTAEITPAVQTPSSPSQRAPSQAAVAEPKTVPTTADTPPKTSVAAPRPAPAVASTPVKKLPQPPASKPAPAAASSLPPQPGTPPATSVAVPETRPADSVIAKIDHAAMPEVAGKTDYDKLLFDEEHLPLTVAGRWVVDKRAVRLDGKTRCVVIAPEITMFDGYDDSHVQLQVTTSNVAVSADSNLDPSYPNQGLRVDDGDLIPFEPALVNKTTTFTGRPIQSAMAGGDTLTVALGFWPTWPTTVTQQASIKLAGFGEAYRALQACARQSPDPR